MSSVSTVFAGESGPDDPRSGNRGAFAFILVLGFILLPVVALSALGTWLAFSWFRIRRSVILSALAIYMILLLPFIFIFNLINVYISSWTQTFPSMFEGQKTIEQIISIFVGIIIIQIPLSIPVGVILGLLYSSWRWFVRPKWEERTFRLTPWEWWQRKKNIEDIAHDRNGPNNGTTLGISAVDGHKVIQTDKEAAAHTLVVGASGSGKTTTLMGQARDIIRREHALVFVDLKGGTDVPKILEEYARRYNRPFRHWLLQPPREEYRGPAANGPAYYDPISRGEATRRKDLIIGGKKYEGNADYYKTIAEDYLQKAFEVLINNPNPNVTALEDIAALLDPKVLAERAFPMGHQPHFRNLVEEINRMVDDRMDRDEKSVIVSLRKQFSTLALSIAGTWLRKDPTGMNDINLKDVADNGEIVVFSLDTSNYPELSSTLGNLIIQDLKTVSSELRQSPSTYPMHVFIDEFSSIESDNVYSLVNKSRDAGIPVTLSTQALGDLRKVGEAFLDQLLGIINAFLIHRTNTEDDAEVYAGLTGTITRKKFRQQVEHTQNFFGIGRGSGSGGGFLEDVEEYRVPVPEIQSLNTGEMIYVAKSDGFHIERVIVIPEDGKLADPNNRPKPVLDATYITNPYQPSEMTSTISYEETATPEKTFTPKPVNKDKLNEIFNRPVDEVLTPINNEDITFEKKLLPPSTPTIKPVTDANVVVPILPTTSVKDEEPPLSVLPARPTTLPPRPPVVKIDTPKKPEEMTQPLVEKEIPTITPIISKQDDPNKDEFDF